MNGQEMYKALNKGVPSFVSVELSIETLINECSSNQPQLRKEIHLISELYKQAIINIANRTKYKESFLTSFKIKTSYKDSETRMFISPTGYLTRLKQILGCKSPSLDYNDMILRNELLASLDTLKSINTQEELKEKFPEIYHDYVFGIEAYSKIKDYENNHDINLPEVKERLSYQRRQFNLYGLDTRFRRFIDNQYTLYRNLVVRRQFVERYANEHVIDVTNFEGLDKERFELYLASKYLDKLKEVEDTHEKQQCLYYVSTYIRETKTSNISIIDENGQIITFKKLLQRYRNILRNNSMLRPIDEERSYYKGYNGKHVENSVKKHFLSGVNWIIVPKGDGRALDQHVIDSLNEGYNYLSPEEREEQIKKRYATYERKMRFFEQTPYIEKVFGIGKFKGYIAFIYENGEVLMEKFFNDKANYFPTIDEAIYNIRVADFERLSRLTKATLMKTPGCYRIVHKGKWEQRGQEVVDKPITKESQEEVKQLLKTLKSKKAE